MLKKLKMLLKLRAWLKSDTLKAGGLIGVLGTAQTFLKSDDGMGWIDWVANIVGLTSQTASGVLLGAVGLVMLIMRAKTEWGLDEKVDGKDQAGFSTVGAMLFVFVVGVACLFAVTANAEIKTFSYVAPTEYVDGTPLPIGDFDYRLECGNTPGGASLTETWASGPLSRQVDIPTGVWFCALRAVTTAAAQYPNQPSMRSNEVTFIVPAEPEAPTNLSVT